jgi:DNA polymerase zeta
MKSLSNGGFSRDKDRWGFTRASAIRITGRHMINIWRVMKGELNLTQYTLENVTFHLLHRRSAPMRKIISNISRIPHYSHADLTRWYRVPNINKRLRVLKYYVARSHLNLEILETQGLVTQVSYASFRNVSYVIPNSEQARLLGIDFYSVLSRGSQFKVESLMVRIAKAECFVLISPSRKQVLLVFDRNLRCH